MLRNYGGIIWTDHALERLRQRNIRQEDAWLAFTKSDQSRYAKSKGAWVYYKTFNGKRYEVVAKQNERKEWIILTVWSKPAFDFRSQTTRFPYALLLLGCVAIMLFLLAIFYIILVQP